jgi:hypothetical protein
MHHPQASKAQPQLSSAPPLGSYFRHGILDKECESDGNHAQDKGSKKRAAGRWKKQEAVIT